MTETLAICLTVFFVAIAAIAAYIDVQRDKEETVRFKLELEHNKKQYQITLQKENL